jgi:hypothetical protein
MYRTLIAHFPTALAPWTEDRVLWTSGDGVIRGPIASPTKTWAPDTITDHPFVQMFDPPIENVHPRSHVMVLDPTLPPVQIFRVRCVQNNTACTYIGSMRDLKRVRTTLAASLDPHEAIRFVSPTSRAAARILARITTINQGARRADSPQS